MEAGSGAGLEQRRDQVQQLRRDGRAECEQEAERDERGSVYRCGRRHQEPGDDQSDAEEAGEQFERTEDALVH